MPRLGVYGLDSSIATYYNATNLSSGFYVIDVADNSPLGECGILPSSVITKFNGRKINNTLDLHDELYKLSSDNSVYVEYVYKDEVYRVKSKLR